MFIQVIFHVYPNKLKVISLCNFSTSIWDKHKTVFVILHKVVVKIVWYKRKLKWFNNFFVKFSKSNLITTELSILELIHVYGGRWSHSTSHQLALLFPPWTYQTIHSVIQVTYPWTVPPLPACWLAPGCAVVLVILSVVLCLWNV